MGHMEVTLGPYIIFALWPSLRAIQETLMQHAEAPLWPYQQTPHNVSFRYLVSASLGFAYTQTSILLLQDGAGRYTG